MTLVFLAGMWFTFTLFKTVIVVLTGRRPGVLICLTGLSQLG